MIARKLTMPVVRTLTAITLLVGARSPAPATERTAEEPVCFVLCFQALIEYTSEENRTEMDIAAFLLGCLVGCNIAMN
jgi:hypothetical protein